MNNTIQGQPTIPPGKNSFRTIAIIVAGGSGLRFGGELPKQFQLINGMPMLAYSLLKFHEADAKTTIILVLPESYISYWKEQPISGKVPHTIIQGGKERFDSVKNGLEFIRKEFGEDNNALVSVHDAARPLASISLIEKTFSEAAIHNSAIPVTDMPYSLRKNNNGSWKATHRAEYKIVQTPQVFELSSLLQAYTQNFSLEFTDDASVYEAAGYEAHLVDGETQNIKVTTQDDIEWASFKLAH